MIWNAREGIFKFLKVHATKASLLSTNASVRDEIKLGEPGLNTTLFATLGEMTAEFWYWNLQLNRRMIKCYKKCEGDKSEDTLESEAHSLRAGPCTDPYNVGEPAPIGLKGNFRLY